VSAIEAVAGKLGNTPAVCKKCYIHPHVLDSYLEGTLVEALELQSDSKSVRGLPANETAVLGLLQRRLKIEEKLGCAIKKETAARSRRRRTIFRSPSARQK
jgi:DNA topoisomerase I